MNQRIVIVGGGLAGMACLSALLDAGEKPILLEAKRFLGGRAGSFADSETEETIDHCQHAAMGCCVNFLDFLRRNASLQRWRTDRKLRFFSRDGRSASMSRTPLLPAPLHFAGSFARFGIVSLPSRFAIARGVWHMLRTRSDEFTGSVAQWLGSVNQPQEAIERFWEPIFVSALGDSLANSGYFAARKVLIDGFLAHRNAADVMIPLVPLGELFRSLLSDWSVHGADLRLGKAAVSLTTHEGRVAAVRTNLGDEIRGDQFVLAVPQRAAIRLLRTTTESNALVDQYDLESFSFAPITGVHLWFDRPIFQEPHAVLTGRLSQWIFRRAAAEGAKGEYYQVVISASHALVGRERAEITAEVLQDLREVFPSARSAALLHSRVVTQTEAVFSPSLENEKRRPPQACGVAGLFLAGDWTATGWPATMESAVRSGYLAAEAVLHERGRPQRIVVDELPRSPLLFAR